MLEDLYFTLFYTSWLSIKNFIRTDSRSDPERGDGSVVSGDGFEGAVCRSGDRRELKL